MREKVIFTEKERKEDTYLKSEDNADKAYEFDHECDDNDNYDIETDSSFEVININNPEPAKKFSIKSAVVIISLVVVVGILLIAIIAYINSRETTPVAQEEVTEAEPQVVVKPEIVAEPEVVVEPEIEADEPKIEVEEPEVEPEIEQPEVETETVGLSDEEITSWFDKVSEECEHPEIVVWNKDTGTMEILLGQYEVEEGDQFAVITNYEISDCEANVSQGTIEATIEGSNRINLNFDFNGVSGRVDIMIVLEPKEKNFDPNEIVRYAMCFLKIK